MATEERNTPRHGRRSAAGKHAAPRVSQPATEEQEYVTAEPAAAPDFTTQPPVAQASAQYDAIPELVSITDGDQETHMSDAPRPIDVDPQETGSFRKISAEEGARLTTRANASETGSFRAQTARPVEAVRMSTAGRPRVEHHEVAMESNKRVFIALGIAALVVVAIVGTLLTRAFTSVDTDGTKPVSEQMQATGEEGIEYRGTTYAITEQDGGKYALTSSSESSEGTVVLHELAGTPVTLILYNTVFIIPENLPDGTWDLIAHPLGGGSVTQQVTDGDGAPIVREGEIAEASLEGDEIKIKTTTGDTVSVSLV